MSCRSRDRESGQALAEFALCVPVMAVVLFGLIEFGLMLNAQISVVNASRDGARVAALLSGDPTQTSSVNSAVCQAEQPIITNSTGSANCQGGSPTYPAGCVAPTITSSTNAFGGSTTSSWSVQVKCTYTPFTPLGSLLGLLPGSSGSSPCSGGGYTICATTTMRDPSCNRPTCAP